MVGVICSWQDWDFFVYETSRPPFAQALEQFTCPQQTSSNQESSASFELKEKTEHHYHEDRFETWIHQQGSLQTPGGGHFNFVCTGVCGHRIGKLTHPQIKAGPSINKNTPILRLFTAEID